MIDFKKCWNSASICMLIAFLLYWGFDAISYNFKSDKSIIKEVKQNNDIWAQLEKEQRDWRQLTSNVYVDLKSIGYLKNAFSNSWTANYKKDMKYRSFNIDYVLGSAEIECYTNNIITNETIYYKNKKSELKTTNSHLPQKDYEKKLVHLCCVEKNKMREKLINKVLYFR